MDSTGQTAASLSAGHHLVLPWPEAAPLSALPEALLEGALRIAAGYGGRPAAAWGWDAPRQRLTRLTRAVPEGPRDGPVVCFNLAFLLADPPPFAELAGAAAAAGLALAGSAATLELLAVAARPGTGAPLGGLLGQLCGGPERDPERDRRAWPVGAPLLPPGPARLENAPSLRGRTGARGGRLPEWSGWLNQGWAELHAASGPATTPVELAQALYDWRERSAVPWIANTLLNEVELRLGVTRPRSVPPEVHLSVTGACNLECRFCGYAHASARFERVTADEVEGFAPLRHARVLRLNSGIGEPTLDRHLGAIVERATARFPQLSLNFFTNALTLTRHGLLRSVVGRVRWVNASLNAASRAAWREQCGLDLFDQVVAQLAALRDARREAGAVWPVVFGSIVLNRRNLAELPRLPRLCRELGLDRLTAFPYFALVAEGPGRFGPEETLEACRDEYDALYDQTVAEARAHEVSLEIPPPRERRHTAFGLEVRPLHDFARVEVNEWTLSRLLCAVDFPAPPGAHCAFLWRQAAVGSTTRRSRAAEASHFIYPCLGPLGAVDYSRSTAVRPAEPGSFEPAWNSPAFQGLREAQSRPGVCAVCDACRGGDTRDPRRHGELRRLVDEYSATV